MKNYPLSLSSRSWCIGFIIFCGLSIHFARFTFLNQTTKTVQKKTRKSQQPLIFRYILLNFEWSSFKLNFPRLNPVNTLSQFYFSLFLHMSELMLKSMKCNKFSIDFQISGSEIVFLLQKSANATQKEFSSGKVEAKRWKIQKVSFNWAISFLFQLFHISVVKPSHANNESINEKKGQFELKLKSLQKLTQTANSKCQFHCCMQKQFSWFSMIGKKCKKSNNHASFKSIFSYNANLLWTAEKMNNRQLKAEKNKIEGFFFIRKLKMYTVSSLMPFNCISSCYRWLRCFFS